MENRPQETSSGASWARYVGFLEDLSAILILLFIVGLISLAIVMRTTMKFESSSWEEIARFLSLWMYMLGVAIASRENSHLKMGFLEDRIQSIRIKKIMNTIFALISFLCICVFAWWSVSYLEWSLMAKQRSLVLMMSMWVVHLSFVVGSFLAAIHMLFHLLRSVQSLRGKSETA
jgi:TRAP-type C4-dicarboxylate transport system permease small subunit